MKKATWAAIAVLILAAGLAWAQSAVSEIPLSWDTVEGAEGYRVHYGTTGSRQYTTSIDAGNVAEYRLADLQELTADTEIYYIAVTAYNSTGEGGFSRELVGWPAPDITQASANCQSAERGGVDCTGYVAGFNFGPGARVEIPYPGVTIIGTDRLSSRSLEVLFTIDASATGGNAELKVVHGYTVTEGTETPEEIAAGAPMSGEVFALALGGIDLVTVVLPPAPGFFRMTSP